MKVVITGGAGFLGKKLARRILQQGEIAAASGQPQKVNELLLFDVGSRRGSLIGARRRWFGLLGLRHAATRRRRLPEPDSYPHIENVAHG